MDSTNSPWSTLGNDGMLEMHSCMHHLLLYAKVVDMKEKTVLYSDSLDCISGLIPIAKML